MVWIPDKWMFFFIKAVINIGSASLKKDTESKEMQITKWPSHIWNVHAFQKVKTTGFVRSTMCQWENSLARLY